MSDVVTAHLPHKNNAVRNCFLAACFGLVALTGTACGGNGTSGMTGSGKSPLAGQVAIANCDGERSVSPVTIVLSCADGNEIVSHAQWSTWDAATAVGTGELTTNDCQPTCASGKFHHRNVDLLAKVAIGPAAKQTFSVLIVTRTHGGPTAVPMIYQLHKGK